MVKLELGKRNEVFTKRKCTTIFFVDNKIKCGAVA